MRVSTVTAVGAALALSVAMSTVPPQIAGAQSPSTTVLVPSGGATLSGSTTLDAAASNATSVEFLLFGGPYGYAAPVVCIATPTYYGWLCSWNTTTVPNDSYAVVSEASGADGNAFSKVSITVVNPPPSTTVLVPASGATQYSTQNQVFEASASPGVTKVSFEVTVDGATITLGPATSTLYGWIYVVSGEPCGAGCFAEPLSASVQSVASYLGGVSGTSPPVYFTLVYYMQKPP